MNDILLGPNYELLMANGDFVIDNSDAQNIRLLIDFHKGNLKQYPLTGVGKERLINGILDGSLRREIQQQLEADGYRLKNVRIVEQNIILDF